MEGISHNSTARGNGNVKIFSLFAYQLSAQLWACHQSLMQMTYSILAVDWCWQLLVNVTIHSV